MEGKPVPRHVYQDLVLDGKTVVTGRRDCLGRWNILEPYLPHAGSILDVGSNLGWFGLKISERFPRCVVASVEADERSATLQREVLASNRSEQICLLTHRANVRLARCFLDAGQRFDAVLCLSVIHWLPDHRRFLQTLGTISRRLIIEHPDPRESGAGVERIRYEIGPIGPYLHSLFPNRPVTCLQQVSSHRNCHYPREMWLVSEAVESELSQSPGLEVSAMLKLALSWPPRSWWQSQLAPDVAIGRRDRQCHELLTPDGLLCLDSTSGQTVRRLLWRVRGIPENRLLSPMQLWSRKTRRLVGRFLRSAKLRPS
jgi:SAM-dependent methyltransferase